MKKKLILLVTIQRAASTYYFDLIRSIGGVDFLSESYIYNELLLEGNRYPIDLCENGKSNFEIRSSKLFGVGIGKKFFVRAKFVLRKNIRWKRLPGKSPINKSENYGCLVEKIHPEFFNFNTQLFLGRLELLSQKYEIFPIYVVREPLAALRSHISYQKRNKSWYSGFGGGKAIDFYNRSFKVLKELNDARPGVVVDYEDIVRNPEFVKKIAINKAGLIDSSITGPAVESGGGGVFYGKPLDFSLDDFSEAERLMLSECDSIYRLLRGR